MLGDDIAVFAVDVEEIGSVGFDGSIADALVGNHHAKAVLHGIDGRCANTAAGGAANENHRVDALRGEKRRERGAKKRAGVLLGDDRLASLWLQLVDKLGHGLASDHAAKHRDLLHEDAAV